MKAFLKYGVFRIDTYYIKSGLSYFGEKWSDKDEEDVVKEEED